MSSEASRILPMMALRDTTFFPGSALSIYVGRDATLRALRRARAESAEIAVFTQLDSSQNDGITSTSVYELGAVCQISAIVELADKTVKLMLECVSRARLLNLAADDAGVALATIELLPDVSAVSAALSAAERTELVSLLHAWNPRLFEGGGTAELALVRDAPDADTVLRALRIIAASPVLVREEDAPPAPSNVYPHSGALASMLNEGVRRRQSALAEADGRRQLTMLRSALAADLAARA